MGVCVCVCACVRVCVCGREQESDSVRARVFCVLERVCMWHAASRKDNIMGFFTFEYFQVEHLCVKCGVYVCIHTHTCTLTHTYIHNFSS